MRWNDDETTTAFAHADEAGLEADDDIALAESHLELATRAVVGVELLRTTTAARRQPTGVEDAERVAGVDVELAERADDDVLRHRRLAAARDELGARQSHAELLDRFGALEEQRPVLAVVVVERAVHAVLNGEVERTAQRELRQSLALRVQYQLRRAQSDLCLTNRQMFILCSITTRTFRYLRGVAYVLAQII